MSIFSRLFKSGSQQSYSGKEWPRFTSPTRAFSIQHPANWSRKTEAQVTVFMSPEGGIFSIAGYRKEEPVDHDALRRWLTEPHQSHTALNELAPVISGDGWYGFMQTFHTGGKTPSTMIGVVANYREKYYSLTASEASETFMARSLIYRRMIDSFRLVDV